VIVQKGILVFGGALKKKKTGETHAPEGYEGRGFLTRKKRKKKGERTDQRCFY